MRRSGTSHITATATKKASATQIATSRWVWLNAAATIPAMYRAGDTFPLRSRPTALASGASAAQPQYIGGVRGLLERNTMRYYLAIDAYLATLDKPLDQRFARWFDATEQYPQQLHEVERSAYLQMKAQEAQRQQTAR